MIMDKKTTYAEEEAQAMRAGWSFDNTYARLPTAFRVEQAPIPVSRPQLVLFNTRLAAQLGLNAQALKTPAGAAIFAGNLLPEGAQPLAQAYAGHQFGYFTMLGDGRAILLGEQLAPDGSRWDIQLKGAGQTPFSRRGDGRAAFGPMLREYLISEALFALGIPSTRSLAVVLTGEPVFRETTLPGAILTRVASSHLRVGTFEYIAARREAGELKILADYTIQRHFPELATSPQPYFHLLQTVISRQAALIAQWMSVGFIHGVMNTDNMTISGESIDYGPCAFMDTYHPDTVFSAIDSQGRYAYGNQAPMAHWNLVRFAETLVPLLHEQQDMAIDMAREALEAFSIQYHSHWLARMRSKLGLSAPSPDDATFIRELLSLMELHQADFTQTFRGLSEPILPEYPLFKTPAFAEWHSRWQQRTGGSGPALSTAMKAVNPAIIPRNHQVELALQAATLQGDLQPLQRLLEALADPFTDNPAFDDYRTPPSDTETVHQTFCGT